MVQAVASGDRSSHVFDGMSLGRDRLAFSRRRDGRSDEAFACPTVTCGVLCLSTFFLVLRLVSKFWLVRRPTWDDLAVCVAWLFTAGLSISIMYGTTVGLGKLDSAIPDDHQRALSVVLHPNTRNYYLADMFPSSKIWCSSENPQNMPSPCSTTPR
jgi:hypothetical protein